MMLEYFIYKQTPPGRVLVSDSKSSGADLLGVSSYTLGVFEVKAVGLLPKVGDQLLLPVKGSQQLSMQLSIIQIEHLITPVGGWNARCQGPSQAQFNVKFADVTCDRCGMEYHLEFIEYSGNTNADAIAGMNKQGWQASSERQICPSCSV